MQVLQLISRLRSALELAQAGQTEQMLIGTELVRDATYDDVPKQAAFLLRAACLEVERVPLSHGSSGAILGALHAIERVEAVISTDEPHAA